MGNSRRLTERQAWLKIAKSFAEYYDDGTCYDLVRAGLCAAIADLHSDESITYNVWNIMDDKIYNYKRKHKCGGACIWPTDRKHALKRARFASNQAGALTRKSKARKMAKAK